MTSFYMTHNTALKWANLVFLLPTFNGDLFVGDQVNPFVLSLRKDTGTKVSEAAI